MPGALVKIRSGYDSLPEAERQVADYILKNRKTELSMTKLLQGENNEREDNDGKIGN